LQAEEITTRSMVRQQEDISPNGLHNEKAHTSERREGQGKIKSFRYPTSFKSPFSRFTKSQQQSNKIQLLSTGKTEHDYTNTKKASSGLLLTPPVSEDIEISWVPASIPKTPTRSSRERERSSNKKVVDKEDAEIFWLPPVPSKVRSEMKSPIQSSRACEENTDELLRSMLERIPSVIAFDESGFEFLDEDEAESEVPRPTTSTLLPTVTSDYIKKLASYSDSGDGMENPTRERSLKKKKSSKRKKKKRVEGHGEKQPKTKEGTKASALVMEILGFGFEDALNSPGSPINGKNRRTLGEQLVNLSNMKSESEGKGRDAMSRYSDTATEPSTVNFSETTSAERSTAKTASIVSETKPTARALGKSVSASYVGCHSRKSEGTRRTTMKLSGEKNEKSKSLSNVVLRKPRDAPKRDTIKRETLKRTKKSLRTFIESNESLDRKSKSVPGHRSMADTVGQSSAFSEDFVVKSLSEGAGVSDRRKKRKKKSRRKTPEESSDFSHLWEAFDKIPETGAESPARSASPQSVCRLRRKSIVGPILVRKASMKSIGAIKTKWDRYVADGDNAKTQDLKTELYKIKGLRKARNYGVKKDTEDIFDVPDDEVDLFSSDAKKVLPYLRSSKDSGREAASMKFLKADWKSYLGEDDSKNRAKHLQQQLDAIKNLRNAQKSQSELEDSLVSNNRDNEMRAWGTAEKKKE
jgi:hypothetical protein